MGWETEIGRRVARLAAENRLIGHEPEPAPAPDAPAPEPVVLAGEATPPAATSADDPFGLGALPAALTAAVDRLSRVEARRKLRDAGYNDEGVAAIEAFMAERRITDYDQAVRAFEREHPPPDPVAVSGPRFSPVTAPTAPDLGRLLAGDDDGFLAQALPAALGRGRYA